MSFTSKLDSLGYVAHYRMGEASGAVVDRSGTANNGTVNNDNGTIVRDVTGWIGGGQDDGAIGIRGFGHIDIPHNASLNVGDSFTFGFGIKRADDPGNSAVIWNKGNGATDIVIYVSSGGHLRIAAGDTGAAVAYIDAAAGFSDNVGHLVIITKNGATTKCYLDGTDVTQAGTDVTFADNAVAAYLGAWTSDGTDRWNGDIDEFFIATTAYTAADVTALQLEWTGGSPTGQASAGVATAVATAHAPAFAPPSTWIPAPQGTPVFGGAASPTDTSAAFASFLNANAGNAIALVPGRTYRMDSSTQITNLDGWDLYGQGATINCNVLGSGNQAWLRMVTCDNWRIRDVNLIGPATLADVFSCYTNFGYSREDWRGLIVDGGHTMAMDRVYCRGFWGDNLYIAPRDGSADPYATPDGLTLTDCTFLWAGRNNISMVGGTNVSLVRCELGYGGLSTWDSEPNSSSFPTSNVSFTQCSFHHGNYGSSGAASHDAFGNAYSVYISAGFAPGNNYSFINCTFDIGAIYAIDNGGGVNTGCVITGCTATTLGQARFTTGINHSITFGGNTRINLVATAATVQGWAGVATGTATGGGIGTTLGSTRSAGAGFASATASAPAPTVSKTGQQVSVSAGVASATALAAAPLASKTGAISGYVFDVHSAANPNGPAIATLSDAFAKAVSIALVGPGSGQFSIPRSSLQATQAIIAQGNLVKVRLTAVSASPIFAFWMDTGRYDLVGQADAPEVLTFGGSGALAYVSRAVMWSSTFLAGEVGPVENEWRLWEGVHGSKAGAILRRVMDEAIATTRPQHPLPAMAVDFTYLLDSSGATWSSTPSTSAFVVHVGDYLDEVIAQLLSATDSMVIQMDAGLTLRAYNTFGVDRTSATFAAGKVRLVKGTNIAGALAREVSAGRNKSHLLVAGDPGYFGTAASSTTPVREGFVSSAGKDVTGLDAMAASQLAIRATNAESIRLGIPFGSTPTTTGYYMPGPVGSSGHYWVGDTITVHTGTGAHDFNESPQRIAEITIEEDDAGSPVVVVALGSTYSGSAFASVHDAIVDVRSDVSDQANEALRYAHSLNAPKVVSALPVLPDASWPMGSIVFLTTDTKLYRNVDGSTWSTDVDGADIVAGTILAGSLAVGAVQASAIAAGAIDATKIAAGAITADAIAVGATDPTKGTGDPKNLIPNGGFETLVSGEATGWNLRAAATGTGWAFRTGSTGGAFVHYGANSLQHTMENPVADAVFRSSLVPVMPGRRYRVTGYASGRTGNNAGASVTFIIAWVDAAGAVIAFSGVDTKTVGGTQDWDANPLGPTTLTAPTNAKMAYAYLRHNASGATADVVYFDDLEMELADQDLDHAGGSVIIDSTGVTITNGALVVRNPVGTVIIDGTSNMFKILATGTASVAFPSSGTGTATRATISATGSSVRTCLWMVGTDNSSTGNPRYNGWGIGQFTDGTSGFRCYGYVDISGGNNRISLAAESYPINPGTTAFGRYHLLVEAAL